MIQYTKLNPTTKSPNLSSAPLQTPHVSILFFFSRSASNASECFSVNEETKQTAGDDKDNTEDDDDTCVVAGPVFSSNQLVQLSVTGYERVIDCRHLERTFELAIEEKPRQLRFQGKHSPLGSVSSLF